MTGKLTFGETLTVEQFKDFTKVSRVDVKKNPLTGKLFFSYGSKVGAVSEKGVPKRPMFSAVCPEGETLDIRNAGQKGCSTFWLLHEEGQGAPTLASF